MMDLVKNIAEDPQLVGLFLDILGAIYLAKSFIFKKLEEIVADAFGNRYYDGVPGDMSGNLAISFYKQRLEARLGVVYLLCGFLLQGIGIFSPDTKLPGSLTILALLLAVILLENLRLNKCSDEAKILSEIEAKDQEMSLAEHMSLVEKKD